MGLGFKAFFLCCHVMIFFVLFACLSYVLSIIVIEKWVMAGNSEKYVYRISTVKEWEELQKNGSMFGGELDRSSGFIHLSKLDEVQSTLQNFFKNLNLELCLLQIDAEKLGDGLIYENVDGINSFPHFYGPSRSFSPLPLDAVTKADKLSLVDGKFTCSFLN